MARFDLWLAAASVVAGSALGGVYFGGLWWTLQRLAGRRRRLLRVGGWLALSFMVRGALVAAAFGLLAALGGWWPPGLALLGFLSVRWALVRRWGPRTRAAAGGERLRGRREEG